MGESGNTYYEEKMTKVQFCGCVNEYQDKKFGKQQRLFNKCAGTATKSDWRCTSCGVKK